ncbi:MAG: amine oxidase, partial [Pseudomonadota bacterium]
LKDLWSQQGVEPNEYHDVTLHISEQVRELMAQRMILVEDLEQVIRWAELTGTKLQRKNTGHFLAHFRPGTVTYWVEYSPEDDGFVVHNAYSHRMELLEELKS